MDELEKVIEKLDEIYRYAGLFGLVFFILLAILLIAFWLFFKSSVIKSAEFEFDKKLSKFQGEIQGILNSKSNEQQAFYNQKLAEFQLDLNKELTKISAEIDIEKSNITENRNEERKSILEFLNTYSELVYGSLDIQILDYGYNNYEEITNRLRIINQNYGKLNVAQNRVRFWTDDQELIEKTHNLTSAILKYSHFTQKHLGELAFNLRIGKTLRDRFVENFEKYDQIPDYLKKLAEEEKKVRDDNDKLYKKYWEEKTDHYKEFYSANLDFIVIANKYLK